jgi:steroid 5-alpha reductase family enzyme
MSNFIKSSGLGSLFLIFLPFIYFYNQESSNSSYYLCAYQMVLIFVKSTFFNHLSAGDEIWSTAPIMYAYLDNNWTPRGKAQFYLIAFWGVRLSYNLWRKGGYRGLEDYRWVVVKQRFQNPLAWRLFQVSFLCIYQMIINYQLTFPVSKAPAGPLLFSDYLLISISTFFILFQSIADQQQWDFQQQKKSNPSSPASQVGFVHTGLWRLSRHPNYFSELGFWWSIFLLTYSLSWSLIGVLTMTLLFQRVILLTERISQKKYPFYSKYQSCTSQLIPWFGSFQSS